MPQQTRIFRVFVSSTFADMRRERQLLRENVFPVLEAFCRTQGARFQAIDLRWGVNEESQRNQKTMEICLNEIRRCQQMSPRPNFLVLLGDRYGWQPAPAAIPETEMTQLRPHFAPEALKRIADWYQLDENAVPAEYVLRPWGERIEAYSDWEPIENALRTSLRLAALTAKLPQAALVKYMASATHQEILAGALHTLSDAPEPESHVLALARTITNLPEDNRARDFLDLVQGRPDPYSQCRLQHLRSALKAKLKDNYVEYGANWEQDAIALEHEQEFIERIIKQLKSVIELELATLVDEDEIRQEAQYHKAFAKTLRVHFIGRKDVLTGIRDYLDDAQTHRPLSLIGASGSGKSSVMAQAVEEAGKRNAFLVCRFIGANAKSSNLISLLGSLCGQIAQAYGTTLEGMAEEDQKDKLFDPNVLVGLFQKCLALAKPDKPLVLFLDALDQLSDEGSARSLYWLPKTLPEHARVVVSSLPELEGALRLTEIHPLSAMPPADGERLLDTWLAAHARILMEPQKTEVLTRFNASGLPLFLKIAFEQARKWHSYDPVPGLPNDVPELVKRFFNALEHEHSQALVSKTVCYILSGKDKGLTEDEILGMLVFDEDYWRYFLDSSHPAHRKEVEAAKKLPVVVWSRLYLDLAPYLTERDSHGERIISFYHRQFNEILEQHYIPDATPLHARLGAYFKTRPCYLDGSTRKKPNVRKCAEQTWQQTKSAMWDEVAKTLCDLLFLEAKVAAGMTFDLPRNFAEVLQVLPVDHLKRRVLALLEEALRRDIHFIARHTEDYPQALLQCLWNSGWWYDCPQAEEYYAMPEGGWRQPPPWKRPGPRLSELLERWRGEKEAREPSFPWLRSHRPPAEALGSSLKAILRGHLDFVNSVAFSPDGARVVSGSDDGTVRLWDFLTGEQMAVLYVDKEVIEGVFFSSDGAHVFCVSRDKTKPVERDKTMRVLSAVSLEPLTVVCGHDEVLTSVAFSPDGTRIAGACRGPCFWSDKYMTLLLWDTLSGEPPTALKGHEGWVTSVAFSPDSERIVSGSIDGTVRIWDARTGKALATIKRGTHAFVNSVAFSPDGTRIASGCGDGLYIWRKEMMHENVKWVGDRHGNPYELPYGNLALVSNVDHVETVTFSVDGTNVFGVVHNGDVHVWNAGTWELVAVLSGTERNVVFSPDGQQIAECRAGATVRIRDVRGKVMPTILHAYNSRMNDVRSIAFNPDGTCIAGGCIDGTVQIWGVDACDESRVFHGQDVQVWHLAFSPDGKRFISVSTKNDRLSLWDVHNGEFLGVPSCHEDWVRNATFSPPNLRLSRLADDLTAGTLEEPPRLNELDLSTLAEEPAVSDSPKYLFTMSWGRGSVETTVEYSDGSGVIARFPDGMGIPVIHPSGRTWISSCGTPLRILTLQGGPNP